MTAIGFIGTGNIGNPMARHVLEAGHKLVVHDRDPQASENLVERGARFAASPAEVAAACRIVFTSLPGPKNVEAVASGPDGLLSAAQPGDIHIDLTTNSVTAAKHMAEVEAARGVLYLDSPVTGGVAGAEAGTLTPRSTLPMRSIDTRADIGAKGRRALASAPTLGMRRSTSFSRQLRTIASKPGATCGATLRRPVG